MDGISEVLAVHEGVAEDVEECAPRLLGELRVVEREGLADLVCWRDDVGEFENEVIVGVDGDTEAASLGEFNPLEVVERVPEREGV